MCVIIVGDGRNKPTSEDLERCWRRNPHGGGAAWYASNGRVTWRKGFTELSEAAELLDSFTGAWVLHFRYITVGTDAPVLMHPFPISKKAPQDLDGSGNASVLFHNGTWKGWRDSAINLATTHADSVLPDGDLSDSRVISWVCSHKGYRFLRLLPGRFAVVTQNRGVRLFPEDLSGGWNEHEGVWYSNTDWKRYGARDGSGGATVIGPRGNLDSPDRYKQSSLPMNGETPKGWSPRKTKISTHTRGGAKMTEPQPTHPRRLGQRR